MSAITAITAQNTTGVRGIQSITPDMVRMQLEAVFEDCFVGAIKTGMLHNRETIEIIAEIIDQHDGPEGIVVDPVMISTSGSKLIEEDAIDAIRRLLFERSTVITPNIDEAEFLTGRTIRCAEDMAPAAHDLMGMGCRAVLMKGGHLEGDEMIDILFEQDREPLRLSSPRINTENTHGTGCTFSSAIAAFIAHGYSLRKSVRYAKQYITGAMEAGKDISVGHGHGPVNHFYSPKPLRAITL